MADPKKKSSGVVASHVEAFSRSIIDWTPAMIRMAEATADAGNLRYAALLCERMMTDDRIGRGLEAVAGVASLPVVFQPPKGGDPETDPVSVALAEDRWKFFPESEQSKCIKYARLLGVSIQHVDDWRRDPNTGRVLPVMSAWSPAGLRYDFARRKWLMSLDSGPEVDIEEEPDRWWLHCPYGRKRPWALAPWRGIARWWLLKQYAASDWAFFSERQGSGTQVVTEEANEYSANPTDEERTDLVNDIKRLGRNAVIGLPKGLKFALIESQARTWETFKAQTEIANTAFAVSLTGQNLTSEVKGGSFAATTVHDQVEGRVIRSEAAALSTDEHDGYIVRYTEYNFGSASKAPYPQYDTKPPSDQAARADVLVKVSTFVANLVTAGFEPDLKQIEEQFGVVLTKGERKQIQKQVARILRRAARAERRPMASATNDIDNGQRYADRVAANMVDHGTRILAPTVAAMMSAVNGSKSYVEALQAVKDKYAGLRTPAELVRLTEAALTMVELGGELSAKEHVESDEG